MPTDHEIQNEKRHRLGGRLGADALSLLVIPKIPFREVPGRAAKAFPDLAEWNRQNHKSLEDWRAQTNATFTRLLPKAAKP